MLNPTHLLFSLGLMSLVWNTYTDLKKGTIDSRRNYFMQGALLFAVLSSGYPILQYLGFVFGVLILNFILGQFWGSGDKEVFSWLMPMLLYINAVLWVVFFIVCGLLLIGKRAFNKEGTSPAMPIILISYVITGIFWYIF